MTAVTANPTPHWSTAPLHWQISIGWLSATYPPADEDADETWDTTVVDPETGLFGGEVDQTDLAEADFFHDPTWVQWLQENVGEDQEWFLFVEDREKTAYRHQRPRRDGGLHATTCYAPANLFGAEKTERDVLRDLTRGLYAYAATKRGWPEPPPPPPYVDPADL